MNEKNLFSTDADCSAQAEIYASIDVRKRLVVEYSCSYDDAPQRDFDRRAVVDSEDTAQMAAYYKVGVEQLPQLLFDRCGVPYDSTPSEADGVFKGALDVILDSGVHYKLSNL